MGRGLRRNKQGGGMLIRSEKAKRQKENKVEVRKPVEEHTAPTVRLPETDTELVRLKQEALSGLDSAYDSFSRVAIEQAEYGERVGLPVITDGIEEIGNNINKVKSNLSDISDNLRRLEKSPESQTEVLENIAEVEKTLNTISDLQNEYIGSDPSIGASRFTRELEDTTVKLKKTLSEVRSHLEENVSSKNSYFKEFLPDAKRDYYQDLHDKHFNASTAVGSVFTEVSDLEELLEKAASEEGGILRDDRDIFIAEGADPEAFLPQCRYLKVKTKGENGLVSTAECDDDEKVHVVRTKAGAPCSLVVERSSRPETNSATLIFGPDPESGNEIVWTAHPGSPIRPSSGDTWEEGATITVKDVRESRGSDGWLQVEVP